MEPEAKQELELAQEVWNRNLVLLINLTKNETSPATLPLYLTVPQHTYLPLYAKQIREHFKVTSNATPWFEVDGKPLQWHYPIGAIFDVQGSRALPWVLTVHFEHYPNEEILACNTDPAANNETIRVLFSETLKQSNVIKFGDANNLLNLDSQDTGSLWGGFSRNDFGLFDDINRKIFKISVDANKYRKVPIRLLQPKKRILVHSVELADELTLYQVVSKLVFTATHPDKLIAPSELIAESPTYRRLQATNGQTHTTCEYEVVIQGIHAPLATPIRWLARTLASPDNFLYIAVRKIE